MTRTFTLNADEARQGDAGGNRIETTNSYIGTITEAKQSFSGKKTEGIELTFEATNGQEARYLTFWTHNAAGEPIYGSKQVQALMTCLSIHEFSEAKGMVKEYSEELKEMVDVEGVIYPELLNKPVGFVLQHTLYTKADGSDGEKMDVVAFFNAESGKTATEIIDKKDEAKTIEVMLKTLKETRDDRRSNPGSAPAVGSSDGNKNRASEIVF